MAIELHHNYSLILDDIMDEDDTRRNHPTIFKNLQDYYLKNFDDAKYDRNLYSDKSSRFAVSHGIILGNITNILSKNAIQKSTFSTELKYKALKILEKTDQLIYHGQILDLLMENQKIVNEQDYLEMAQLKTAELFGISFQLGSMFAGCNSYTQFLFRDFGIKTAIAFQLQDDLLDLGSGKGHALGSDIKKGKKTLLMIKTLENSNETQKKIIYSISGKSNATNSQIKAVNKIMLDTGAIQYCKNLAMKYSNEAQALIDKLDIASHDKQALSEFSDYLVKRPL
jgi:geranylgeranyl pyrophosphate synthase